MNMKKTLLKGAGYAVAPKLSFAANNPGKAAFAKATKWAGRRVLKRKPEPSMGMTALKGLGAAAVAIPVGLWLGRRFLGGSEQQSL